jgi:hypothetical protein
MQSAAKSQRSRNLGNQAARHRKPNKTAESAETHNRVAHNFGVYRLQNRQNVL